MTNEMEIKEDIIKIRKKLYSQAIKDNKNKEIRIHLETNYNNCNIDNLVDSVKDILLDSFGS